MRKIYLVLTAVILSGFSFSQNKYLKVNGVKIESYSQITGLPMLVTISKEKNISDEKFPMWLKNEFLIDKDISFEFIKKENDQLGFEHYRYQQLYKGYKIESSMVIAHSLSKVMHAFNGDWFTGISVLNSKTLNEQQALQFALNKVKAQKYKWENKAEEEHMKQALKDSSFSYAPKGELVVLPVIDYKQKTVSFLYTYKFNIYAEKPLYRAYVFVDAATGTIVKEQNLICTIDVPATANTKYSGTQTITTDNFTANNYRLRETSRGNGIETYNLNNGTTYVNTDFTNTTTTWATTGTDQIATDAHWGAEQTYDFYNTTFNRNSIDGNGYELLNYVHYDVDYVNAFWDGQRMTYGDGKLSSGYKEFTAIDVCGHEITHGVVQFCAQLNGGEADALNEGFADIFGTAVEWFARPTQHNWLIGDEVKVNGVPLRNMSNPSALQQPDTYMGTNWDLNDEPHKNNGPCIYWYYLLSIGGNGTNDNGDAYNVSGLTMNKATAIAYRALNFYMTPNTNYAMVRDFTIQAAKDLYGSCSNEVKQTTNAWYAVGVGAQYTIGAINPEFISHQAISCTVPAEVSFINQTNSGSSFLWYFGDGTTSTASSPTHTYSTSGLYTVKLVATNCMGNLKDSITKVNYVNVNTTNPCIYNMPSVATTYSVCSGVLYDDGGPLANYTDNSSKQITIVTNPGDFISLSFLGFDMEQGYDYLKIYKGYSASGPLIGSYTGSNLPNNGNAISTNTNVITVLQSADQFLNESGFEIQWACNSQTVSTVGIAENSGNAEILMYPNPATSFLTFDNINDVNLIEVISALGQIENSQKINNVSSTTLSLQNLACGIYIIKLYTDKTISTKKVIKQ